MFRLNQGPPDIQGPLNIIQGSQGKIDRGFPGSTSSLTSGFARRKNKKSQSEKSNKREVEQLVRLPFLEETKSNKEVEQNYKKHWFHA